MKKMLEFFAKIPSFLNQVWGAIVLIGGAAIGYFMFVKKQMPDMPERPPEKPELDLPKAPKTTDHKKEVEKKLNSATKEVAKKDSQEELAEFLNKKYGKDK